MDVYDFRFQDVFKRPSRAGVCVLAISGFFIEISRVYFRFNGFLMLLSREDKGEHAHQRTNGHFVWFSHDLVFGAFTHGWGLSSCFCRPCGSFWVGGWVGGWMGGWFHVVFFWKRKLSTVYIWSIETIQP